MDSHLNKEFTEMVQRLNHNFLSTERFPRVEYREWKNQYLVVPKGSPDIPSWIFPSYTCNSCHLQEYAFGPKTLALYFDERFIKDEQFEGKILQRKWEATCFGCRTVEFVGSIASKRFGSSNSSKKRGPEESKDDLSRRQARIEKKKSLPGYSHRKIKQSSSKQKAQDSEKMDPSLLTFPPTIVGPREYDPSSIQGELKHLDEYYKVWLENDSKS